MVHAFQEKWEDPPNPATLRADLGKDGLSLEDLGNIPFEDLGQFKVARKFPHGYSSDVLSFYSPRDEYLHTIIIWTLLQVTHSLAVNMFGFDDPQAAALIREHTQNPRVAVTVSLDSTQAAGKAEAAILAEFNHDEVGNSIAIGRSSKGAISHDKLLVVDGQFLITGSTNWSYGGEALQDNQLTLSRDALAAAEARSIIDMDHDDMLKQMARKAAREANAQLGEAHAQLDDAKAQLAVAQHAPARRARG